VQISLPLQLSNCLCKTVAARLPRLVLLPHLTMALLLTPSASLSKVAKRPSANLLRRRLTRRRLMILEVPPLVAPLYLASHWAPSRQHEDRPWRCWRLTMLALCVITLMVLLLWASFRIGLRFCLAALFPFRKALMRRRNPPSLLPKKNASFAKKLCILWCCHLPLPSAVPLFDPLGAGTTVCRRSRCVPQGSFAPIVCSLL
jgi:hypothetical protein